MTASVHERRRMLARRAQHAGLLGALGVLLAWLDLGFHLTGADQQLYIPFIKHYAHPTLYARDYLFDSDNYRATLFVPLLGTLHRWLGGRLESLLLVAQALMLWVLFTALAATVKRVASTAAALWAVVLLSWPVPIPGAAASLWEMDPHPRTAAFALALVTLYLVLDRRPLAALPAVGAFLLHPLLGGGVLVCGGGALTVDVLASDAAERRSARRALVGYVLLAALLVSAARLVWSGQRTELPWRPVDWWLAVATAPYLWMQRWGTAIFASLAGWLLLFWLCRGPRTKELRRLELFGLGALPFVALALLGMVARSPLLVSLQLHRCYVLFIAVTIVQLGRTLDEARQEKRLPTPLWAATALTAFTHSLLIPWAGFALALAWLHVGRRAPSLLATAAALLLMVATAMRFRPHRVRSPGSADWLLLQRWAHDATSADALFVAPLGDPDFRVFSERASVVGHQDAAPAIFNSAYAAEYLRRAPLFTAY